MFDPAAVASPVLRVTSWAGDGPRDGALTIALAMEPGPKMIDMLSHVDVALLDDVDRVLHLQAWERASRWVAAQHATAVVGVAGPRARDREDLAREAVAVALVGMGGSPKACVDTARALAGPLRVAREALARGEVSEAHVTVLARETAHLPAGTAAEVAVAVTPGAVGKVPSRFRRLVRRAVIDADPAAAAEAEARASTARRVTRRSEPDGQATLAVTGPAVDVMTIWTALDLRASLCGADDPRTLDQRRFDALAGIARDGALAVTGSGSGDAGAPRGGCDQCDPRASCEGASSGDGDAPRSEAGAPGAPALGPARTAAPGRRRGLEPAVYVYADAATWAGLADGAVELDGYGPIPAGAARAHFASSAWRAVVTDALTQRPIAVSDTTYRPGARTRRLLHLRDRTCVAISCTAPVWFCDADHGQPHDQGGCTDAENCGLLCRRHHRMKTFTAWSWTRDPEDDAVVWTDPQGQTHRREPDRYPMPPRLSGQQPHGLEPPDDPPF